MATAQQVFHGTYEADPDHSSLEAGVRHMGVGLFRMRLSDVSATLSGEDGALRLQGRAAVESISIRNPPEFREHVVYGADFFDARKHPYVSFASDQIELGDDGTLRIEGELTIKGITRPIAGTGTYREPIDDPYGAVRTAIDVSATIDRRDFEMDWQAPLPKGGDVLDWHVELDVHLELIRR